MIPIGIILYTVAGGLKATFLSSYIHTVIIYVVLCLFAFLVYSPSSIEQLGSPGKVRPPAAHTQRMPGCVEPENPSPARMLRCSYSPKCAVLLISRALGGASCQPTMFNFCILCFCFCFGGLWVPAKASVSSGVSHQGVVRLGVPGQVTRATKSLRVWGKKGTEAGCGCGCRYGKICTRWQTCSLWMVTWAAPTSPCSPREASSLASSTSSATSAPSLLTRCAHFHLPSVSADCQRCTALVADTVK